MSSAMFGKAKVMADGQELLVNDKSKLTLAGFKNHTVKGPRVYGFAQEAMEAQVDMTIFVDANTDLDAINNMTDVTILFQCDSGQNYVLPHAWLCDPVAAESATTGGTVPLKFAAKTSEKI